MERQHYLVYYMEVEGTEYHQRTRKAATIMGVAEIVAELHKRGTHVRRWEKVLHTSPPAEDRQALDAFLQLMSIPRPPS